MDQSSALVPPILHFHLKNFNLRIVRNLTDITIEAENHQTSQFFSKILSDAEVKQYDNIFYNTIPSFHKILNEAFQGGHDHIEASIDDRALITLITKFKVAGKDKQSIIQLQLVEKQLDSMKECERLLISLGEQRPNAWGVTESQFYNVLKRMFQNQQMLMERMEGVGHNGMNKSVALKDKKYDGIETLAERLKSIEGQIEEINEFVVDGIAKAEHSIATLEKNVEQIQTEVKQKVEKMEKSLVNVVEQAGEIDKRLKKLESEGSKSSQGSEVKQHIEKVEERINDFEKLNNVIMADTQVKVENFRSSIEDVRNRLNQFEANHEDLSRRVKRVAESPERQTKGEPGVSNAELGEVKESIEGLAKKVREISGLIEAQDVVQKERYNEFVKATTETEKKLIMIKEIYVSTENRLKSLEEARKAPAVVPEEVKNEGDKKDIPVELKKESIVLKNEEPVFRKDRSKPGLAIQSEFKPNFFDGDFKFTNNNQIVESPHGIIVDRTLFGRNPLPKKGKYCLSIQYGHVTRHANGVFAIGVAVSNSEIDIVTPGCFFITPFEKVAYINGMDINYHSADLKNDEVICIIIDRQENLIAFEINGKVIIEDRLNPDFFDDQDLYPCVHIQQCSDLKLSFIA